jgi:hypothetical protein
MNIELKNLKTMASLSEETPCYTATIYINGERAFEASNRGHGGSDDYHRVDGYTGPSERQINEWLAKNKPLTGEFATLDNCLEFVVGDLINKALAEKALRGKLNRQIIALGADKDGAPALFSWPSKFKPVPANIDRLKESLAAKGSTDIVLNGLPVTDAAYQRALELV